MEVKLNFDTINVFEENNPNYIKVLMLKGEKGDKGDPGSIVNEYSTSTTDGYSANYINQHTLKPEDKDNMGNIAVDSVEGKNLYNKNNDILGKVLSSDGSETSSGAFCISEYIEVLPNTEYTISRVHNASEDLMRVGYYTSNKTFISRPHSADKPWTITTPNNCAYIKISYEYKNNANTNVQVEPGSQATSYQDFNTTQMGNVVVDDIKSSNLFDNNFQSTTKNGITSTYENGVLTLNGTATAQTDILYTGPNFVMKANTAYTLTLFYVSGTITGTATFYAQKSNVWKGFDLNLANNTVSQTRDDTYSDIDLELNTNKFIRIANGTVLNNYKINVQINRGGPTNYVPYKSFDATAYVLWTNLSPTSEFASQSITLNSDDYSYFDLYYKQSTTSNYVMCTRVLKGYGSRISFPTLYGSASGGLLFQRNLTRTNDTTFTLGDCEKQSGTTITTENTSIIPLKIIGHK